MTNANNCPLCASAYRAAANSMMKLGASVTEIAESCGVEESDVTAHFQNCVAPRENSDDGIGGTDSELRTLLADAEEHFHAATLAANPAAASSALNVRLRILSELGDRERRRAEQSDSIASEDPRDPKTWSEQRRKWLREWLDEIVADSRFAQKVDDVLRQKEETVQ